MQPPPTRGRKQGRRSSTGGSSPPSTSPPGRNTTGLKRKEQLSAAPASALASPVPVARDSRVGDESRAVLSGRLSRCSPVFGSSSETVFCACSSSVFGVSVDTGEQLLQLVGHVKDVTAMAILPSGVHKTPDGAGGGKDLGRAERLLTASLDGTLRLWDISADLLSFEGEAERCLHVFHVGMPVYQMLLGRQDINGAALDVILVTKEGRSSLHGLKTSSGGDATEEVSLPNGRKKPPGNPRAEADQDASEDDVDGDTDNDNTDDTDDTDGTDDDDDGEKDVNVSERKNQQGVAEDDSNGVPDATGGVLAKRKGEPGHRRKALPGAKHVFDWQAARYNLAKGAAEKILIVTRGQRRWVGAIAPRSPVPNRNGKTARGAISCPVLLSAVGRIITAVDVRSGDETTLMRGTAPVCSLAVGGDGELLVTGHLDGSMSQWHALPARLGAAFGVSGFEGAEREPSTDMHWHAHPVSCMKIAADGVQLLSGGEEAVLVQWNLTKGTKAFLPRLGAPLQDLAVSPGQDFAVVTSRDNAVTLVGLAGWDVMWQMRGLALSRPRISKTSSQLEKAVRGRQALKMTMEPRRGLVACNGRAGHVQFYNVATDCLEASAEIVRFNRVTSAKTKQLVSEASKARGASAAATAAAAAALVTGAEPMVERVVFSTDGKRMVAVASRMRAAGARLSPSLSFWKHARGADPFGTGGYTGSYTGARNGNSGTRKRRSLGGAGSLGHWASDTTVENPHGFGKAVTALEYHPTDDVAVTASEDGAFNLWGLRRTAATVESLAARGGSRGPDAAGEQRATHWACSLSVRYKAGLSATGASFCSDGSVLAVSYAPTAALDYGTDDVQAYSTGTAHGGQGIITLWSLETVTLLSTLLPPRTRDVRNAAPLETLGFLCRSGRVFAAGGGYAAVWDTVFSEPTPLWEYRAKILAAATADTASVFRSGKAGVVLEGRGVGDVALCIDAASVGDKGNERGSIVLLLNSGNPTPLHSWRLPDDYPTCLRLLLDTTNSGGQEGVLCLTRRGELLLLSAASGTGAASAASPGPQPSQVVGTGGGVGVVRIKHGATAPALHLSTAAKRRLLEVDLAGSDPALIGSEKRLRGFGDEGDDDDDGHTGGREAGLRSGQRASDILDPSSINLAPVPDLYEAFMKTVLKPAPREQQSHGVGGKTDKVDPTILPSAAGGGGGSPGVRNSSSSVAPGSKKRGTGLEFKDSKMGKKRGGSGGEQAMSTVDEGLLSVLTEKLKAGDFA